MARNNGGGSPTIIHKIILGVIGVADIGAIVWILTHDVPKMASRRGIAVDGTIVAFAIAYCAILAAIHLFGIYRVVSVSDPEKAAALKESKLTVLGEMILFAGLLMVLVGILILGPGVAAWSILLALALIAIGGLAAAVGINRTVLKTAIIATGRRRRQMRQAQDAGADRDMVPQPARPRRRPR